MRPSLFVARLALGALLVTAPAAASDEFPPEIVKHLGLSADKTPDCTLCHATEAGGLGTVTTLFGKQGLARGLQASDTSSLDTYLDASAAEGTDSDGDGVPDIQELKNGTDPNAAPGQATIEPATYGCSMGVEPRTGSSLAGLVAALCLLGHRRRRGRPQGVT